MYDLNIIFELKIVEKMCFTVATKCIFQINEDTKDLFMICRVKLQSTLLKDFNLQKIVLFHCVNELQGN